MYFVSPVGVTILGSGSFSDGGDEPHLVFWCDTGGKPLEYSFQGFRIYAKNVKGTLISKAYTPFSLVADISLINESREIPGDPAKS